MSKHRKNSRRKKYINRSLIKFVKVLFLLFNVIGFPKHFSRFSNMIFDNWQFFALLVLRAKSKFSPEDFVEQFLPGNEGLLNSKYGALLITPLKNENVPVWRTSREDTHYAVKLEDEVVFSGRLT